MSGKCEPDCQCGRHSPSPWLLNREISQETRAKLSAAAKLNKCPPDCTCGRHASKGTKRDPAIGAKISAAKMGHDVSAETRAKIGATSKGRIPNQETRDKMSAASTRHGYGRTGVNRTPEYRTWDGMKQRCYNPNNVGYAGYGALGITVCDRWRYSFENFLADMGEKPEPKSRYSIERIDGHGNYEPGNCKWATASEQQRNRVRFNPNKARKCEPGCTCGKHRKS